jgi:hypothetical protein
MRKTQNPLTDVAQNSLYVYLITMQSALSRQQHHLSRSLIVSTSTQIYGGENLSKKYGSHPNC